MGNDDAGRETKISYTREAPDGLLYEIVHLVNKVPELGIGITVFVGGAIITGTLVGWQRYYQRMAEEFMTVGNPIADALADRWREIASPEDEDSTAEPRAAHLLNAQFFQNGQLYPTQNLQRSLWRGRIASVDGFTLLTFSGSSSSSD